MTLIPTIFRSVLWLFLYFRCQPETITDVRKLWKQKYSKKGVSIKFPWRIHNLFRFFIGWIQNLPKM